MNLSDYSEEIYNTIQYKYIELNEILRVSIYLKLYDKIEKYMTENNIDSYDDIRYINERNRTIDAYQSKIKEVLDYLDTDLNIDDIKHYDDLLLTLCVFNSNLNVLQHRVYVYNMLANFLGIRAAKNYDDKVIDIIEYVTDHIYIVRTIVNNIRDIDHNGNRCKSENTVTNRTSLRSMLVEPIIVRKGTNSYTQTVIKPDYGSNTPYIID